MKSLFKPAITFCLILLKFQIFYGQETIIKYLSGTGNENIVDWEFYCTEGRNSGKWTTIPVPSNWELQGFGKYNYGHAKDSARGKEKGLYKYNFNVPKNWKDKEISIVFEGSMTDTEVKINGQLAGPIHQGAFYRFKYNITELIEIEKINLLEVTVSKHSENESVNKAERYADYWIFGGIFRPVYLEAKPKENIDHIYINATAEGKFSADIYLNKIEQANYVSAQIFLPNGKEVGPIIKSTIDKTKNIALIETEIKDPLLWSPEFPNFCKAKFTLLENEVPIHVINEKFGFRTVELRERDGIYLNNIKIKFKGVCRHSFWPSSGRTLSKKLSIMDAELIKDMNMNAVRNSHYPADKYFYEVCDSLGILVLDELGGWHDAYDTETGSKLVKEMLNSNMNHPSIVMWINGNEGGHNHELLPLFDKMDIQKRPVIHAWEVFRGMDTQHYINYDYGTGTHFHGHDVVFPTEFLHGLYDGGHGAGLYDYWELMWHNPLSAGGLLWDYSDEAVVRIDRDGELDTDGAHAPDGVLGPYREKEGSYFTIKEVWSPIFFEHKEITKAFDGDLIIENRYHYTNIKDCKFTWELSKMPLPFSNDKTESKTGKINSPDIIPGHKEKLKIELPEDWHEYDILYIKASDPYNREIYTWNWHISLPSDIANKIIKIEGKDKIVIEEKDTLTIVRVNGAIITFNKNTGLLQEVKNNYGIIPISNGPLLCDGEMDFKNLVYRQEGENLILESIFGEKSNYKSLKWNVYPSGWVRLEVEYRPENYLSDFMGINFSFPEEDVTGIQWMGDGPYRVWKNRMQGNTLNVWEKDYNNTITGDRDYIYPEFKGYHSRLYWAKIITTGQPFLVVCNDEDVFLRLFTPEFPSNPYNTAPPFPKGDISFLQGIPPIGTKSQIPENMGPSGRKNMYFDYWKARPKKMTLFFNFSGEDIH
ncbi:glycoside hydrolase family 2 TIM barrel-domain containing protein [Bacteroidota bacterium]